MWCDCSLASRSQIDCVDGCTIFLLLGDTSRLVLLQPTACRRPRRAPAAVRRPRRRTRVPMTSSRSSNCSSTAARAPTRTVRNSTPASPSRRSAGLAWSRRKSDREMRLNGLHCLNEKHKRKLIQISAG